MRIATDHTLHRREAYAREIGQAMLAEALADLAEALRSQGIIMPPSVVDLAARVDAIKRRHPKPSTT